MTIKPVLISAKNTIIRHRATVAVVATSAVCYAISRRAVGEWDSFLAERGLLEEYYTPEENV